MMLHQSLPPRRRGRLRGTHGSGARGAFDLIVTIDAATGAVYSAFLIEEEGTASTFRAARGSLRRARPADEPAIPTAERITAHRESWRAKSIGGHPTQVGRALEQIGIEHIGAYSPHSPSRDGRPSGHPLRRGRSEQAFGTPQDRLPIRGGYAYLALAMEQCLLRGLRAFPASALSAQTSNSD